MGLWQTGYIDKIDTGYDGIKLPDKPKKFVCKLCDAVFMSHDDLNQHRFQEHPFKRPALYFRGEEVTSTRKYISRKIFAEDILVTDCSSIIFNGQEIEEHELAIRLENQCNGLIKIGMLNDELSAHYELYIQIPKNSDLLEIDTIFFEIMSNNSLSTNMIDLFADLTSRYPDAARYVDGIISYLYGVLIKDQKNGASLSQEKYREKYNQALDALYDYKTLLAVAICAIVNLNFNVFDNNRQLAEIPWLYECFSKLNDILFQTEAEPIKPIKSEIKLSLRVPLDSYTEKIINWILCSHDELGNSVRLLEKNITGPTFSPEDRFKLRVLVADYYFTSGDRESAAMLAKPAINDVMYGAWAERLLALT